MYSTHFLHLSMNWHHIHLWIAFSYITWSHNLMWNAEFSSTIKCNRMLHFCIQYLIWVGMSWWPVLGANHQYIFFQNRNFRSYFMVEYLLQLFIRELSLHHKWITNSSDICRVHFTKTTHCNLLNLTVMFSVVLLPLSSSSWVTATPSGAIRYRKGTVPSINQFIWKAWWRLDKLTIPEIEAGVDASSVNWAYW